MIPLYAIGLIIMGVGLLVGASGCAEPEDFPKTAPPPDPPDPDDVDTPPGPRPKFDECSPPTDSFQLMVEGGDLGCSVLAVDRETICVQGEPCSANSEYLQADPVPGQLRFTGKAKWVSYPLEFFTSDPGDPGYGLMAQRTQRRANAEALATYGYGEAYPALASRLGLAGAVEGVMNLSDCSEQLTIKGAVFDPISGDYRDTSDFVAMAFYTPVAEGFQCTAAADFLNEQVRIKNGTLAANFTADQIESQEIVPACGAMCTFVPSATEPDQSNPSMVGLRLIREPFEAPRPDNP